MQEGNHDPADEFSSFQKFHLKCVCSSLYCYIMWMKPEKWFLFVLQQSAGALASSGQLMYKRAATGQSTNSLKRTLKLYKRLNVCKRQFSDKVEMNLHPAKCRLSPLEATLGKKTILMGRILLKLSKQVLKIRKRQRCFLFSSPAEITGNIRAF